MYSAAPAPKSKYSSAREVASAAIAQPHPSVIASDNIPKLCEALRSSQQPTLLPSPLPSFPVDARAVSMAAAVTGWLRGVVKEVPSGDTVVVAAAAKPGTIPNEKRITLSSVIAPKLVRPQRTVPRRC